MIWRTVATLSDVWDGICSQPGRVLISFITIVVGIASLTGLFAVLNGLQGKTQKLEMELGLNVLGILYQGEPRAKTGVLNERHVKYLSANMDCCLISSIRDYRIPFGDADEVLHVVATDSALINVRHWTMAAGRFLDPLDTKNRARNAVISAGLSRKQRWHIGHKISIGKHLFQIVGIVDLNHDLELESEISDLTFDENVVFVPKTVTPYWLTRSLLAASGNSGENSLMQSRDSQVDAIFIKVPAPHGFEDAVSLTQRLLAHPDYYPQEISFLTPASLTRRIKELREVIGLTMGSITILCLVLGGTTLLGLMVLNVKQRVAEIGLRRTLGASERDIIHLFLIEAIMITGSAAVVAISATHLVLALGMSVWPIPIEFSVAGFLFPMAVAIALGLLFSYFPAMSAARIQPSEALRDG